MQQFCVRAISKGRFRAASVLIALSASFCVVTGQCVLSQMQKPAVLPSPGHIGDVVCISDAAQSYALYLPSAYGPAKRWPIIYFFDPGGRGRRPLELYKEVAETYGFILAGSNNSRNFSSDQGKAVNAIWEDTHARLELDEHRSYSSGFSGGARVAGAMALGGPRSQIAGVIAHGAGYPSGKARSNDTLPYFFAVGDQDFNWPEVINIRREREEQGWPYRVRVYAGRHQWAPAAVMEEAVQYMNLKAMQAGSLRPDGAFVDHLFDKTRAEAAEAETRKDPIEQLNSYRSLVTDFSGLRDGKEPTEKLTALQQSPGLKAALKGEREQMSEQLKLEQEISQKITSIADNSAPDTAALRVEVRQQMGSLGDQAKHSKNETQRLIAARAFGGILVGTMEDGQQELTARHFEKAEAYFDIMRQASDDPWPVLLLADTHATAGNRRLAVKDLQEAVRRGLKDRAVIESDPQLQSLKSEPEFQKLLAGMEGK
jgi:dienelactone hydrolase